MLAFSSRCPVCGVSHDYQSSVTGDDAVPEDGDLTLCIGCGSLLYFDMEIEGCLRVPTAREQVVLDADPEMQMVLQAWKQATGTGGP